jgi:hypothetical protein
MNSHRKFILASMMQAWLVPLFFLLGFVACLGISKAATASDKLYEFTTFAIYGPAPILLCHSDISHNSKIILWFLSTLIYWPCLGIIVGHLVWKTWPATTANNLVQPPKGKIRLGIAALAVVLAIITIMSLPSPTTINTRGSIQNAIINNLRQIDAAKNEFALEKKISPDYVPTETDLLAFIKEGKIPHVGPERYVLNAIGKEPYAIFEKDWRIRRSDSDWSEGYTITNGTTYRLP